MLQPLANLRELAQDFYEREYAAEECWRPIFELLQAGGFVDVTAEPLDAIKAVREVWWHDDPRDPLTLVQPWDWLLLRHLGRAVEHPALVVDGHDMIHLTRKNGVRIEPIRRHRHRLLQIARHHTLW